MTMRKIALFRLPSGTELVGDEVFEKHTSSCVRLSEYIEVTFPMLPTPSVNAALEIQRQVAITYHRRELARLVEAAAPVSIANRQAE